MPGRACTSRASRSAARRRAAPRCTPPRTSRGRDRARQARRSVRARALWRSQPTGAAYGLGALRKHHFPGIGETRAPPYVAAMTSAARTPEELERCSRTRSCSATASAVVPLFEDGAVLAARGERARRAAARRSPVRRRRSGSGDHVPRRSRRVLQARDIALVLARRASTSCGGRRRQLALRGLAAESTNRQGGAMTTRRLRRRRSSRWPSARTRARHAGGSSRSP